MITLNHVLSARERISPYIIHTPLVRVPALDDILGCRVYLKLEGLQITGSFKLRGALNRMLCLTDEQREIGVVGSSSGNHAQALAYVAGMLGIDAKIIMPEDGNPLKIEKARKYGGNVILVDKLSREQTARDIARDENRVLVHAFDDPFIKAGQGTIAPEMLEDEADLDAIVVPVGGAGLLSGIAVGAKGLSPAVRVYGVEHRGIARYTNCKKSGIVADITAMEQTIADGVMGTHADQESYDIIHSYVDELLLTDDRFIRPAVKAIIVNAHVLAEPASCMALAVALAGELPVKRDEKVAFVLTGGNCNLKLLAQIMTEEDDDNDKTAAQ